MIKHYPTQLFTTLCQTNCRILNILSVVALAVVTTKFYTTNYLCYFKFKWELVDTMRCISLINGLDKCRSVPMPKNYFDWLFDACQCFVFHNLLQHLSVWLVVRLWQSLFLGLCQPQLILLTGLSWLIFSEDKFLLQKIIVNLMKPNLEKLISPASRRRLPIHSESAWLVSVYQLWRKRF